MSSKNLVKVKCSRGCSITVNLDKHLNRDYVMCPKHHEQIKVRKSHFFSPSPEWQNQRDKQAEGRVIRWTEKQGKRQKPIPFMSIAPHISPLLAGIMARYQESKKKKEEGESEQS